MRLKSSCCLLLVGFLGDVAPADDPLVQELRFDPLRDDWTVVEEAPSGTPLGDLQRARQAFAAKEYDKAHRRIKKWIKAYENEEALRPEALVFQARVELARNNYDRAHKALKQFLDESPAINLLDEALHYEFIIAEAFLAGAKREFLGMKILSGEERGLEILDDLSVNYSDYSVAELAIKTKADHFYFRKGEFALAEMDYARLVQQFPRGRYLRYAMLQTARAALNSFAGTEFDDAPLIEAEQRFHNYLTEFPRAPERDEITVILQGIYVKRAEKEFSIGRYYERARRPTAAGFYYSSTVKNWPDTVYALRAEERLRVLGFMAPATEEPTPPSYETPKSEPATERVS